MSARILVLAGSARSSASEALLAGEAMRRLAVTDAVLAQVHPADYPLPLFDDSDDEAGLPQNARLLAARLALQDGLVLVARERGPGAPAMLLNMLEWMAAAGGDGAFRRLVVAIVIVSEAPGGGALCAQELRTRLAALGADVVAPTAMLSTADTLLDEAGRLARSHGVSLDAALDALLDHARALGRQG